MKATGVKIRVNWRDGHTTTDLANSVEFENGFVFIKQNEKTTVLPASEFSKFEFLPDNIAWD